jgi:hypothetical protein
VPFSFQHFLPKFNPSIKRTAMQKISARIWITLLAGKTREMKGAGTPGIYFCAFNFELTLQLGHHS